MDFKAKLEELCKDEGFMRELLSQKTPEDAQSFFREHDIDLSLDDVKFIGNWIGKTMSGEIDQEKLKAMADGELSEDELEEVAGGVVMISTAAVVACAIIGGTAGTAGVISIIKFKDEIGSGISKAWDWVTSW